MLSQHADRDAQWRRSRRSAAERDLVGRAQNKALLWHSRGSNFLLVRSRPRITTWKRFKSQLPIEAPGDHSQGSGDSNTNLIEQEIPYEPVRNCETEGPRSPSGRGRPLPGWQQLLGGSTAQTASPEDIWDASNQRRCGTPHSPRPCRHEGFPETTDSRQFRPWPNDDPQVAH